MKRKFTAIVLAISIMFSCCSCSRNKTKTPEQDMLELSREILKEWGVEEGRTFRVTLDEEGIYTIDINGDVIFVKLGENNQIKNQKYNITECDEKIQKVINSSKSLIKQYINESLILVYKEELVDYIESIPVKLADFSDNEFIAEYSLEDDVVYINKIYKDYVSEWMTVHELVHALCQKTNEGYKNLRYPYNLFNEVITDIITASMSPKIQSNVISGYAPYHEFGYLYLGCFGEEGLKAYFYGYENILEKIPEEELDIFVQAMDQLENHENAIVIVCNCINKWGGEN